MLKIKDNVDLKVLKKYGFLHNWYYDDEINDYVNIYMHTHITIRDDRKVIIHNDFPIGKYQIKPYSITVDIIYDLIQDGLIEKVEG